MADTLKAYDPSWRDYLGSLINGDARQGSLRSILAQALVGSNGVGTTPGAPAINAADFSPAFPVLAGNEAYRDAQQGNYTGAALQGGIAALGTIPLARGALKLGGSIVNRAADAGIKGALTPVVDNATTQGENVLTKPVDRRALLKGGAAVGGGALAATILPHANLLAPAAEVAAPAAEAIAGLPPAVIKNHLNAIKGHLDASDAHGQISEYMNSLMEGPGGMRDPDIENMHSLQEEAQKRSELADYATQDAITEHMYHENPDIEDEAPGLNPDDYVFDMVNEHPLAHLSGGAKAHAEEARGSLVDSKEFAPESHQNAAAAHTDAALAHFKELEALGVPLDEALKHLPEDVAQRIIQHYPPEGGSNVASAVKDAAPFAAAAIPAKNMLRGDIESAIPKEAPTDSSLAKAHLAEAENSGAKMEKYGVGAATDKILSSTTSKGILLSSVDSDGNITHIWHDNKGRPIKVPSADDKDTAINIQYDDTGKPIEPPKAVDSITDAVTKPLDRRSFLKGTGAAAGAGLAAAILPHANLLAPAAESAAAPAVEAAASQLPPAVIKSHLDAITSHLDAAEAHQQASGAIEQFVESRKSPTRSALKRSKSIENLITEAKSKSEQASKNTAGALKHEYNLDGGTIDPNDPENDLDFQQYVYEHNAGVPAHNAVGSANYIHNNIWGDTEAEERLHPEALIDEHATTADIHKEAASEHIFELVNKLGKEPQDIIKMLPEAQQKVLFDEFPEWASPKEVSATRPIEDVTHTWKDDPAIYDFREDKTKPGVVYRSKYNGVMTQVDGTLLDSYYSGNPDYDLVPDPPADSVRGDIVKAIKGPKK